MEPVLSASALRALTHTFILNISHHHYALHSRTSPAGTGARRSLTLSAVDGPVTPPLETPPLYQFFKEDIIGKHGSRPAFICREERPRSHGGPASRSLGEQAYLAWEFDKFDRYNSAAAPGLLAVDVRERDRMSVIMGNAGEV
ncbi:hypothetical protein CONPUDRAFT_157487 [Coniophora puteana RWD-64-598 SS2]|uniref:Uncharacterized protein n=1 Tax=Coniophora puteana (strain RWD-64-598) TaxID=741705 RepID=A0A5M3MDM0_CONPW|nr:uncharacterized protein CONPUDRAFT_157487 [Coniophora puteana RWD-64-598 SS2]EIW77223.1 hypothetical protein CONPUDRAFT_157487 [Coniophora puteana RWD-64-598 SS2]